MDRSINRRKWLGFVAKTSVVSGLMAATSKVFGQQNDRTAIKDSNFGIKTYNVRDFGAVGDGKTLDTKAIQKAIDTCNKDLGGTVYVPAGVFLTGTLEMKSNVTLHIAAQGKILGTAAGTQYYPAEAIPTTGEWTMGDGNVGLIFAANAENVTIEGQGTIDGQGTQFKSATPGATPPAGISGKQRPHHLLFYQCKNLTIRDIYLTNGAYHSVRVCVCSYVKINGIRIYSRVIHNNDGLHFISCQFVHVSNCDIKCQDDACALFGSNKYVTIESSSFSTRWSVFRFGGGFSENITVSNCLIYETYGCPIKMRCDWRSRYENISFSNLVMDKVTGPISIGLGPQKPGLKEKPGIVKNISFSNIRATVVKPARLPDVSFGGEFNEAEKFSAIILNGMDEGFIENISFNHVHITFPGGGTAAHAAIAAVPKIASEYYVIGVPPAYGLFARNVKGLTLNDVRFEVADNELRPAMVLENVTDAGFHGFSADGHQDAEALVRIIDCRDISFNGSRMLKPAKEFLQLRGSHNEQIKF